MSRVLLEPYELVDDFYFFYNVELPGLEPSVVLDDKTYVLNSHLHISLLTNVWRLAAEAAESRGISEEEAAGLIREAAAAAIAEIKPRLAGYLPDVRLANNGDDQSVVVMADMTGLDELQQKVGEKVGIDIPSRPAHVTLYLLPGSRPVPIRNQQQLQACTRPLTKAELEELRTQIDFKKIFGVNV